MSDALVLLVGVALGFSLTVPPGPMNALIAARTVRSLRAGVATGLGAMTADAVLGALVYGLRLLVNIGPEIRLVEAGGAALLAVLAYRVLREPPGATAGPLEDFRAYSQALAVGVSNPFQILWWLTAGLAFAYVGGLPLFLGLFGAIAVWVVAFPALLRWGIRRRPRAPRAITLVSGALLIGFAAYFAALALGLLV